MALLRNSPRGVSIESLVSKHIEEFSSFDAFEILIAFFFTLKITRISRTRCEKIWPRFMSDLRRHGVRIPNFHDGTESLHSTFSRMVNDELLTLDENHKGYTLLLTDIKVKHIMESASINLRQAVMIVAPKIFVLYQKR